VRVLDKGLWLWTGLEDESERRRVISEHLAGLVGCPAEELVVERDTLGRPFIARPQTDLQFSQARRDGFVVLAASEQGAVGVDVDLLQPGDWQGKLAGDFFAPKEKRWLDSLAEEDRTFGFFRLWTGKEAVLKALGLGIAQGMAEPDFSKIIALRQSFLENSAQLSARGKLFHLEWWSLEIDAISIVVCKATQDS